MGTLSVLSGFVLIELPLVLRRKDTEILILVFQFPFCQIYCKVYFQVHEDISLWILMFSAKKRLMQELLTFY